MSGLAAFAYGNKIEVPTGLGFYNSAGSGSWLATAGGFAYTGTLTLSGAFDVTARMTTTDGVASGTARVIGGRAYAAVADSTTVAGGAGAQAYDVKYTIPANTLKSGTTVYINGSVKAIAQNGTDTFLVTVKLGSTTIAVSSATDIAANDRCIFNIALVARADPSASAAVVHSGSCGWTTSGAGPLSAGGNNNYATNGALDITVSITYGSTNAGNTSALESLNVSIE